MLIVSSDFYVGHFFFFFFSFFFYVDFLPNWPKMKFRSIIKLVFHLYAISNDTNYKACLKWQFQNQMHIKDREKYKKKKNQFWILVQKKKKDFECRYESYDHIFKIMSKDYSTLASHHSRST